MPSKSDGDYENRNGLFHPLRVYFNLLDLRINHEVCPKHGDVLKRLFLN